MSILCKSETYKHVLYIYTNLDWLAPGLQARASLAETRSHRRGLLLLIRQRRPSAQPNRRQECLVFRAWRGLCGPSLFGGHAGADFLGSDGAQRRPRDTGVYPGAPRALSEADPGDPGRV